MRRNDAARRGFTLVELLVAMILFVMVSGLIYSTLQLMQRVTRSQTERSSLQANVRGGAQILATELRELGINSSVATSDIQAMSDSSIVYRAMRSAGVTCQVTATEVRVINSASLYSGTRLPLPGRDSLLVFVDTDTLKVTDDQWTPLAITGTVSASTCPGGQPAYAIPTTGIVVANVTVPGPVRTFEVMQLARYNNAGKTWLGARSVSAGQALQEVLGPVTAGNGIQLTYRDVNGSITTSLPAVRMVDFTVRGLTQALVVGGAGRGLSSGTDSLSVRVTVRNAR